MCLLEVVLLPLRKLHDCNNIIGIFHYKRRDVRRRFHRSKLFAATIFYKMVYSIIMLV